MDRQYVGITVGVESAVVQAAAVAGDDIVGVGPTDIVRQRVNAVLLDELAINLVPVLLGEGHPSRGSLVIRCEGMWCDRWWLDCGRVAHRRWDAADLSYGQDNACRAYVRSSW
jgi:hypothetical protein